ncbi:LOW QUALITY PROTEIN: 26S proteasome non-ATPase regulatory subunit 5 [Drosophila obscura]|uniref:LOW QUALITY PROTEIN: 26S proteasome non-ATPase regulatory subunit 5 n=1 Tax=Drosophila obscura TaxID=7282 RepID=UPI001BB20ABB|nr:LOW QUALITY PROTEIN: 26S proteasome non-ATPase regulatory subunit 5 [Drosophila obscura]
METTWWVAHLKALHDKEQRLEALNQMNTAINKAPALSRETIELLLNCPEMYECATIDSEDEQKKLNQPVVDATIELLRLSLDTLEIDTEDEKLPGLLKRGLTHSNASVRAVVLNNLLRELRRQTRECSVRPLPSNDLIVYVLDELQQPESECSSAAISILAIVLTLRLDDAEIQSKLVQLLQQNEVIRCRAYELGVMLAKRSAGSLKCVEFILDAALSELDNTDVLLQASVMEILVPLADQNHGLTYMERRRVFDVISSRVQRIEQEPLNVLLIPNIMKFFGKIGAVQPQKIITDYPIMVECLFDQLKHEDESILPTAMDTLANLTSTPQGKVLISMRFEQAMLLALKTLGVYLQKLSPQIKVRLLESLNVILATKTRPNSEITTILRRWYESFAGGEQVNYIMGLYNTPFDDLQIGALNLLKTLCTYNWGIVALHHTGGAVEHLVSRQRDLHKDVKFLKWEIVGLLAGSSEFTATETVRFTAYVNEGPYYVPTQVNIATESQG